MITRTCQHCGREYQTFPSIKPLYCSMACSSAAKVKGEWVPCDVCGTPFWRFASRPDARYCSKSCAITARNLTDANPAYRRDISGDKNPMYGRGRSGSDNPMYGQRKDLAPRWTGGHRTRPDGYVFVIVPDNHPHPSYTKPSGTKYLLAHRYVMEQHLGRYLDPVEVVHHIDGDPTNNAIDNLQLFASQSDHISIGHAGKT